jgi:prolyl 4-hydroxylase
MESAEQLNHVVSVMLKAGHPIPVISQRVSVELQVCVNDLAVQRFVEHRDNLQEIQDLLDSKWARMEERGFSSARVKALQDLIKLVNQLKLNEEKMNEYQQYVEVPKEYFKGVDNLVCDDQRFHSKFSHVVVEHQKLDNEMRRKTYIQRITTKANLDVEKYDTDSAPMFGETTTTTSKASTSSQHSSPSDVSVLSHSFAESDSLSNLQNVRIAPVHSRIPLPSPLLDAAYVHLPGRMYSVSKAFSPQKCNHLIEMLNFTSEEVNYQQEALVSAQKLGMPIFRNNYRREIIHEEVAMNVWDILKNVLPQTLPDGRELAGVRTRMYYYRYSPGQVFRTHYDGGYLFRDTGCSAAFTFIIYLNDDFEGGSTRFCEMEEWKESDEDNGVREIRPEQGRLLTFLQSSSKHCGSVVMKGDKHILQGMVMYGPLRISKHGMKFLLNN